MIKNYQIGQNNELVVKGAIYDIHNNYDFHGLIYESNSNALYLEFKKYQSSDLGRLVLSFEVISYFKASENFFISAVKNIDEFGYKKPRDYDDSWLLNEEQSEVVDHFFVRMEGGHFLRVYAEKSNLKEL